MLSCLQKKLLLGTINSFFFPHNSPHPRPYLFFKSFLHSKPYPLLCCWSKRFLAVEIRCPAPTTHLWYRPAATHSKRAKHVQGSLQPWLISCSVMEISQQTVLEKKVATITVVWIHAFCNNVLVLTFLENTGFQMSPKPSILDWTIELRMF